MPSQTARRLVPVATTYYAPNRISGFCASHTEASSDPSVNMTNYSQYDEDEYRLPEGMTRTGYDADTQVYFYRDAQGKVYQGAPGNQYGVLRPGSSTVLTTALT